MAARRYEISLRDVKIYFSTPEEKFRISNRPRNVLFIINLLFNTDEIPNHFTRAPIIAILSNRRQKTVSVTA